MTGWMHACTHEWIDGWGVMRVMDERSGVDGCSSCSSK